jgi:hypothetical protein
MRLDDTRRTTQGLGDLLLETPYGWVPVRHIAEIREGDGPNQILRENGKRRAVVLANADGSANMARVIADVRRELSATVLPQGVFAAIEGTFQAQEEASRTIGLLSLLSMATIFTILYSRYRSAILALIIMGSVPLALVGSVTALWIAGQPLSVASMVGFITLTGIASRNGILKISHYINLALHENLPFGQPALRARTRHPRQSRAHDTRAHDGAGGRIGPASADGRSRRARQGSPLSGRGHDLRRVVERNAARRRAHADAVSALRREAARPPDRRRPRSPRRWGSPPIPRLLKPTEPLMPRALILIAALFLATTAFAHGPNQGPHGGVQVDAGNTHVELVIRDRALAVYLHDESQKPIDAKGAKAVGIFVIDGKSQRIELLPDGPNTLSGTSPVTLPGALKGVVRITFPNGTTVQAKF